jgi:hypothetical protein
MAETRRKFDTDFRERAVRLVRETSPKLRDKGRATEQQRRGSAWVVGAGGLELMRTLQLAHVPQQRNRGLTPPETPGGSMLAAPPRLFTAAMPECDVSHM